MTDRATIPLSLPESGATIHLYEFMVSGDYRRLQRKLLDNVRIKLNLKSTNPKDIPDVNDVPGSITMDDQDEAVRILVQKITDKDGNPVPNIEQYIYDLPMGDGDLLFARVKEITDASRLSPADKKK